MRLRMIYEDLQRTIPAVIAKYPGVDPNVIESVAKVFPEQAIEWVVKSLSLDVGQWPEDTARFLVAWQVYQTYRSPNAGNDLAGKNYQAALKAINPSIKNPLNYTLREMEHAARTMDADQQAVNKSNRQVKREQLAQGTKLVYSVPGSTGPKGGEYRFYQILTPEAASIMALGSQWCTSDPKYSTQYISEGPLYIVVTPSGEKLAQLHPDSQQYMDVHDQPIFQEGNEVSPDEATIIIDFLKQAHPQAAEALDLYEP